MELYIARSRWQKAILKPNNSFPIIERLKSRGKTQQMKFEAWFQRNSHLVLILVLFLYVFGALLAPVLMKKSRDLPAKIIYWIYSNFCHQFAHRSWFLFGKQSFYPMNLSANKELINFDTAFGSHENEIDFSRSIIGNELFGFKMAFCQRDLAMYSSMALFGIFYLVTGRKIKRIPISLLVLFGLTPLGIDGVFQLFGSNNIAIPLIGFWESTPTIRSITGILFGVFTGWFIFPSFDLIHKRKLKDKKIQ